MEDGDDDTSPTAGFKHNGKPNFDENNVTTENEEGKVSFSSQSRLSPYSSKEELSHSESGDLDKEEDLSDEYSKNKSSDPLFDANTSVVLEDNDCDKIQKFEESEPMGPSDVSTAPAVIEPSDKMVYERDDSEFLDVPGEVSNSKDEASVFASVESADYAHSTLSEEETETNENKEQNSSFDELVSTSSEVQTTDETPDTSLTHNESNVKSESGEEEGELNESLVLPCSVTANGSGDVSTGSDINQSDSNSEGHDESFEEVASQKYKDASETFDSSSNVNVSFCNETDSSDSLISQSSANNSISQPDGHNPCSEETDNVDRVDVSVSDTPEPEGLCESLLVNEEEEEEEEEDDEHLSASSEESESESVKEEPCSDREEEIGVGDSEDEKDGENCITSISNIEVEMKHDEDVEEMEVDSYEWKENEMESCSVAETDRIDVGEELKKDNEVKEQRSDAMCVDDDTNSSDNEIEQNEVKKQQCGEVGKNRGKETFEDLEKCEYLEGEKGSCANIEENVDDVERDVSSESEEESHADIEEENEEQRKDAYLEAEKESNVNIGGGKSEEVEENVCFKAEKESCTDIEELEKNESLEVEKESHDIIEKNSSEVPEKDEYLERGKGCLGRTDRGSSEELERKVFSEIGNESHTYTEVKNSEEMETEISDNVERKGINSQSLDLEDSMCDSEGDEHIQKSQTPEIMKDDEKYLDSNYVEHKEKGVSVTSSGQSSPNESFFISKDTVTKRSNDLSECIKKSKNFEMEVDDSSVKVNGEVECAQGDTDEQEEPIKEKVILKRKLEDSPTQELSSDTAMNESCKMDVCFKGFKKRYIAQVSEAVMNHEDESPTVNDDTKLNNRSIKTVIMEPTQVIVSHQQIVDREESDTPLTEYAQYLGLQPTVKFKCYNCGESGFPSMMKLQEHQNTCLKNDNSQCLNKPPPSPSPEPLPSTNFRITRKVYLCSACGTYYENWNLFIHMKEVHNRHICLFCLVMFSQAEKLAAHLFTKHGISEGDFDTPQDFLNEFNSAFFVMCCTCEQLFNESDNFFDHPCGTVAENVVDQACSLCGLRGAHFPTCRRAFTDSSAVTSPPHNSSQTTLSNSEHPPSIQSSVQEKAPKYLGSADKSSNRKSHQKQPDKNNASEKRNRSEYCDDDYDISDAASYCHVNIDEPEKQKNLNQRTINETSLENCESASDSKKSSGDFNEVDKQDVAPCESEIPHCAEEETNKNESCDIIQDSPHHPEEEPENPIEKELSESSESSEPVCHDTSNDSKSPTAEPHESMDLSETQNSAEKEADADVEIPSLNHSKSPKEGDSESDTSASAGDTHGSDDSSSGSEASSDENDTENKGPSEVVKATASDESDGDKSDSDKMSIVVDDTRSGDDDPDKEEKITDCNTVFTANENIVNDAEDCKNEAELDVTMNEEKSVTSNNDSEDQQDNIQVAGDDVPLLELTLEETMDTLPIQAVVKECVKISCGTCVYCNHAKKIAVNGKQLVLHLLAEHRFEPVVCSDSGELTPITGFVENLKAKLTELQDMYFNTDSYDSADKTFTKPYDRTYECFHCHFITTLHKELYVHNRKMHQKTILLCIMCKSNFYSYSELLCHLCPGIYVPDSNIAFRCCLCVVDGLPSAFRLMVHLRKRHHACDVCLETTGDQQKLSNHVWKHKLHHLCYRCGIAYRNKPDITKHLFWKHGTESVLCKKCLQKKWPHVYHFCIPPTAFLCEECNASFSRAVALKVHKRLHVGDIAYECDECQEKFISKKLLRRHKDKHKQVDEEERMVENAHGNKMEDFEPDEENIKNEQINMNQGGVDSKTEEKEGLQEHGANIGNHKASGEDALSQPVDSETNKRSDETTNKRSKVVDVYDLPPLNLSSESDDSEDESVANKKAPQEVEPEDPKIPLSQQVDESTTSKPPQEGETQTEEETQPVEIVDGVWDNFKNYKASLEKREILQAQVGGSLKTTETSSSLPSSDLDSHTMMNIVLADHDYCIVPEKPKENAPNSDETVDSLKKVETLSSQNDNVLDEKGDAFGADHNYCYNTSPGPENRKESTETAATVAQAPIPHPSQTPPSQLSSQIHTVPVASTPNSSPKKKQKSPKKKQKQSGSSSSSDSSSNSDSSSCTCGTNCSCSSSSSSSSGSSSSSSDSDSSSSEGRRRQAARRERRRERAKRKLDTESRGGSPPATAAVESQADQTLNSAPTQIDSSGGLLQVDDGPPMGRQETEESEFMIRESDLDTTETETDEDFYDKYPQRQANKLLAEKRNQLLLLAAVAPVNNGTINQPSSPPPAPAVELPEPVQKKKGKTKRHKRAQHHIAEKKVESKLKLNIPASYYSNPSFSVGNPHLLASPVVNSQNVASSHTSRISHETFSPAPEAASTPSAYHSTGSGSETESKRLSKRKRIPKRFYGDSSDEEAEHTPHQPYKWRKVVPSGNSNPPSAPAPVPSVFTFRNVNVSVPAPEPVLALPLQTKSDDDGDDSDSAPEAKRSSSDSSNSDSDNEHSDGDSDVETAPSVTNMLSSVSGNMNQQKNENLYCYCQCPYDEVSEMIACDGKDCSIEWFHFECVGIMVPPKGKWFCPDCRKKTAARSEYLLHA